MDVKCTFLNGKTEEEIFIKSPEGLDIVIPPGYGLRLLKSLYGLKQSPRFYVHVDDLIIGGNEEDVLDFKANISKHFDMEDLGECQYVLGMRVTRDRQRRTIQLNQDRYISNVLDEFGMSDCKPASTPLPQQVAKIPISSSPVSPGFNYPRAMGLLNYLVQCTRPDLVFSWSYFLQFLKSFTITHQQQFLHLLRYLKKTANLGIKLGGPPESAFKLSAYCDADHASSTDQRSFSGRVLMLNGPISWQCSKEAVCALSTTEAEHRSCSESGQDLLWTTQLLACLSRPFNQ